MKCPSAEKGFCPSKDEMEEHSNDWWTEYYCQDCGHEGKVHFDQARRRAPRRLPTPTPPIKKVRKNHAQ